MFACIHHPGDAKTSPAVLQKTALKYAPHFEMAGEQTVVFPAGGLQILYPGFGNLARAISKYLYYQHLTANIALAPTPDTAILATGSFAGITVLDTASAAGAIAPLSISELSPSKEIAETLLQWGIETLGQLAKLPTDKLVERLGSEARYLQLLARGTYERALMIYAQEREFEFQMEFDHRIDLLEPLLFVLNRGLNNICDKLKVSGYAAQEIELVLPLEKAASYRKKISLPNPLYDAKVLLKIMQLELEADPPQAPVSGLSLLINPCLPQKQQGGLFIPQSPEPAKLEITLARIRKLVGEENVGQPQLVDTNRPEAFRLTPFGKVDTSVRPERITPDNVAFRYLRPAQKASVKKERHTPVYIKAKGVEGHITKASGVWRSSGEWWRLNRWIRDERDVAVRDGNGNETLYRIYFDWLKRAWFVEGTYD